MKGQHQNLWAPWRMEYIASLDQPSAATDCFFCDYFKQPNQDAAHHVIHRSERGFILMNRYPYTNGHLLAAVNRHVGDPSQLDDDDLVQLTRLTYQAVALLQKVLSPDGFNLGANLGHCAGAGVPGHLHHHIVPRWGGDTNFLSTIANVRVIPQGLDALYEQLTAAAAELELNR